MGSLRSLRTAATDKHLSKHGQMLVRPGEVLRITYTTEDGLLRIDIVTPEEIPEGWKKETPKREAIFPNFVMTDGSDGISKMLVWF